MANRGEHSGLYYVAKGYSKEFTLACIITSHGSDETKHKPFPSAYQEYQNTKSRQAAGTRVSITRREPRR